MNVDTNKPFKTKARRWFRFNLRTLLVIVTISSVPLGWVGWELDQRRREKSAIAWVQKMGGEVHFNSPTTDERSWGGKTEDKWFGESEQVSQVSLVNTQVSDLSPLAELMNLRSLYLDGTQVSDLSPLAELKNLEWLNLSGTQVSDLLPLAELKNLGLLTLNDTLVSDEQVQELRMALPNIGIFFD